MVIRGEVRKLGEAHGFEVVRFCSTEPFEDYKKELGEINRSKV